MTTARVLVATAGVLVATAGACLAVLMGTMDGVVLTGRWGGYYIAADVLAVVAITIGVATICLALRWRRAAVPRVSSSDSRDSA